MKFDYMLDASGETCPMPLLRAKQKLNQMAEGECLKVIATDQGSVRDFASFIQLTPHELVTPEGQSLESSRYVYYITKR